MKRISSFAALASALCLSAPAGAATAAALSAQDKHDMACFMGISLTARDMKSKGKMNDQLQENLGLAIFYYGGKIATRHPGQAIAPLVKSHAEEAAATLKTVNAQTCMAEVRKALGQSS
ncbi:MAG: hypothetical protein AB7U35_01505 [Sphingobium sp.]